MALLINGRTLVLVFSLGFLFSGCLRLRSRDVVGSWRLGQLIISSGSSMIDWLLVVGAIGQLRCVY